MTIVYVRLATSRILSAADARPAWSVSCFYVKREYRRRDLTLALLEKAVRYARQRGAKVVEGYPQDAPKELPAAFAWTGRLLVRGCANSAGESTCG